MINAHLKLILILSVNHGLFLPINKDLCTIMKLIFISQNVQNQEKNTGRVIAIATAHHVAAESLDSRL